MRERAVIVGENPALVGILTEPLDAVAGGDRPACVLLNAGLVHRVGPNRLYVRLSRALAAAGFRAFRFDLSGRGDSDVRRDGVSFTESSVTEVGSAIDYLTKAGSRQFVLIGICSGAVNALQLALADARVVGCVAIDAPAYPTAGYYARRYFRRLGSAESWRNAMSGRNALGRWLRGGDRTSAASQPEDEFGNPFGEAHIPPRHEAAERLRSILAKGTRLFFIFSGSWSAYNYRKQFSDAFPFVRGSRAIRVEYFSRADHTFTRLYTQQRLVEEIQAWTADQWATRKAAACSPQGGRVEPMAYRVQRTDSPDVERTLTRLWTANLQMRGDPHDKFRWYYRENPLGPAVTFLLEHIDGGGDAETVGSCGVGTRRLYIGGRPVQAALFADFTVDKPHRTLMPAMMLQRALCTYAVTDRDMAYAFPNEAAVGIFNRIGLQTIGHARRYVKVLRSAPFLLPRLRFSAAAAAVGGMIDVVLRFQDRVRPRWARRCHATWINEIDGRFDALFARVRPRWEIIGDRGAEFLQWRFAHRPGVPARVAALLDDRTGDLRAYAVAIDKAPGEALIADFLAENADDLSTLLAWLGPRLASLGYRSAVTYFLGARLIDKALERAGFQFRNEAKFVIAGSREGGQVPTEVLARADDWYLTEADRDN